MVDEVLMAPGYAPQFAGQGEGEQKVGDRQQHVLLLLEPLLSFVVLTLGAMAVTARVVQVFGLVARRPTHISLASKSTEADGLARGAMCPIRCPRRLR